MQIFSSQLLLAADDLHGVKEYTVAGTYTFKLSRRTRAKLTIVGSGMARTYMDLWIMGSHGGSWMAGNGGGYFVGCVMLPPERYTITLNESIRYTQTTYDQYENKTLYHQYATTNNVILSNTTGGLISVGTSITQSSNLEIVYGTVEHEEAGNQTYTTGSGGASLYNGYGKGSDSTADNQTTGYFKIEW